MSRFKKREAAKVHKRPKRFAGKTTIMVHPDGVIAEQLKALREAKKSMGPSDGV